MRLLALGCVLATVAAATPSIGASGLSFTGVEVRVVRLSAGEIQCIRAPCTLPEARIDVTVFRGDSVVARGRTSASGRVRFALVPGVYTVRAPRLARENGVNGRRVVVTRDRLQTVVLIQRPAPLPGNPRD